MKLSDLVIRWKDRGLTKPEALDKAKAAVKKAGKRWTASQQLIFDTNWKLKLKKKQVVTTAPAKPAKVLKPVIKPLSKLKPEKIPVHPKFIMPRHPDEDDLVEIVGEIDLPEDLKKMTPFQHEQVVNWTMHRDKAEFQRREKALKVLLNLAAKDKNKMLLQNAKIVSDLFYKVKLTKGAKWKEVSSSYPIPPKDSYVEL